MGHEMRERLKRYANRLPFAGLVLALAGLETDNDIVLWIGLALASPVLIGMAVSVAIYVPCLVLLAVVAVVVPPVALVAEVWCRLNRARRTRPPARTDRVTDPGQSPP